MLLWTIVAADAADVWVGGHLTTGAQADSAQGVGTAPTQVEVDLRAQSGNVFVRIDLDYHVAPFFPQTGSDSSPFAPVAPLPPEYALVQVGDRLHLRFGVTNPQVGYQNWDEKDNPFATYSLGWLLTPGQNLGLEPGIWVTPGTRLFAWGGYDLAWSAPVMGVGVETEQDTFATWTGFTAFPTIPYGMLLSATEFYLAEWFWFAAEVNLGASAVDDGPTLSSGGQLIATVLGDEPVGLAVRVERQSLEPGAQSILLGDAPFYPASAAIALRATPEPRLRLTLEGKLSSSRMGARNLTATLLVSALLAPESADPYAVR